MGWFHLRLAEALLFPCRGGGAVRARHQVGTSLACPTPATNWMYPKRTHPDHPIPHCPHISHLLAHLGTEHMPANLQLQASPLPTLGVTVATAAEQAPTGHLSLQTLRFADPLQLARVLRSRQRAVVELRTEAAWLRQKKNMGGCVPLRS